MIPSQVSLRLRMIASAIDKADRPDSVKLVGLLTRVAEAVPLTERSPRADDWQDVEFAEEEVGPSTERSPDLQVRSKQFVSDMEAGVHALSEIVRGGTDGREGDMRGELDLVTKGAEGLSGLL